MATWKPSMDKVPFELKKRIMNLYGRRKSAKDIAPLVQKSIPYVQEVIRQYRGTRNIHFRSTERMESLIIKMYIKSNVGVTKIARYFNTNQQFIHRILKRNDILIRKPNEYRKYTLNENYFNKTLTEEQAYWLGFIMADGCISRGRSLMIRINERDLTHLKKIQKTLSSNSKIRYERDKIVNFTVHSRTLCTDLAQYGIVDNKTFTTKIPDIPKYLIRHFIRGLFDGDGSLSINNKKRTAHFTIAASNILATQIQDVMVDEIGLSKNKLIQRSSILIVSYGGRKQVLKICDWLYKDATVYLDRKYAKYKQLAAEYKSRELLEPLT